VFLVSHDRRFLDNVVTSTIAWEGDPEFGGREGLWREYEGGYEDWKQQRERGRVLAAAAASPVTASKPAVRSEAPRAKLSYKEQRELDALPARIEALEAEQATIATELAGAEVYTREPQRVPQLQARHEAIDAELLAALERWEVLGSR
jgi:ATP-binding cassette subfamily F protein uup